MNTTLKPCPFCGSEKPDLYSVGTGFGDAWCVLCPTCGASTKGTCESRDEAAGRWNMRTAVGDPDFSMAIHDGGAWQRVRECHSVSTNKDRFTCSECGHSWPLRYEFNGDLVKVRHCPSCGAKVGNKVVEE